MGDFGHVFRCRFFQSFVQQNRPPLGRESPRPAAFEVLAPERMVVMLANVTEKTVLEPEISGRPTPRKT